MRFIETIKNISKIEDLRKRIIVTFLLVLVYRVGCYVVLPGINPNELDALRNFTDSGICSLEVRSLKPRYLRWVSCLTSPHQS